MALLASSSEVPRGQCGEIAARPHLRQDVFRLLAHGRLVFALGLQQDVAGTDLFGHRELLEVRVVEAFNVLGPDVDALTQLLGIDEDVSDLPPLADAVLLLVRVEIRGELLVGRLDAFRVLGGPEGDDLDLDLLVAPLELLVHFGVTDRDPPRDGRPQLVEHDRPADTALELVRRQRRPLHLQQLAIPLLADELPVLLERGELEDSLTDLDVGGRDALAAGLDEGGALVDELLEDLTVQPQLTHHGLVEARAVRITIRLQLRVVGAVELDDADWLPVDLGDRVDRVQRAARVAEKGRDVEDDEGEDDERQAPLEPVPVTPHPIEHGHGRASLPGRLPARCKVFDLKPLTR